MKLLARIQKNIAFMMEGRAIQRFLLAGHRLVNPLKEPTPPKKDLKEVGRKYIILGLFTSNKNNYWIRKGPNTYTFNFPTHP